MYINNSETFKQQLDTFCGLSVQVMDTMQEVAADIRGQGQMLKAENWF